jgi:EamA domain-containing membrane protein RarD
LLVQRKIAQSVTSAETTVVAIAVATVAVHSVNVAGNTLPYEKPLLVRGFSYPFYIVVRTDSINCSHYQS